MDAALGLSRLRARRERPDRIAWFARLLAVAVGFGIIVGVVLAFFFNGQRNQKDLLFSPDFAKSGLVTNEYAYWNHGTRGSVVSDDWSITSGSLFARNGSGWTGPVDATSPNADSSNATDSAVFRLRSRAKDFGNVGVGFDLKVNALTATERTPSREWDGVHVWLHYQNAANLYYVSVSRRDGEIVIGKKANGVYVQLSKRTGEKFPLDRWRHVETTIVADGDNVTIRLLLGDELVERVTDGGRRKGPALIAPGRIGLRGDNADFQFRDLRVKRVS